MSHLGPNPVQAAWVGHHVGTEHRGGYRPQKVSVTISPSWTVVVLWRLAPWPSLQWAIRVAGPFGRRLIRVFFKLRYRMYGFPEKELDALAAYTVRGVTSVTGVTWSLSTLTFCCCCLPSVRAAHSFCFAVKLQTRVAVLWWGVKYVPVTQSVCLCISLPRVCGSTTAGPNAARGSRL